MKSLLQKPLTHAVSGYLAIRSLIFAIFVFAAFLFNKSPHEILSRWDAAWYERIATIGYGHLVISRTGRHQLDYAFFPLFPTLERWGHALIGSSPIAIGLVVNFISSIIAAVGIFFVARHVYTPQVATYAVAAWALMPAGYVQWLAYSESTFTAFAAWSLYALLKKRWLSAGVLACASGVTRALGIAVVVAIGVAAFQEYYSKRNFKDWRPLVATLISPIGLLVFLYWVGKKVHRFWGYFWVQKNWGMSNDFGLRFASWLFHHTIYHHFYVGLSSILLVAFIFAIYYRNFRDKQPLSLLAFTTVMMFFTFAPQGFFECKPRYLMPAFTLLFPIAIWLSKREKKNALLILSIYTIVTAIETAILLLGKGPP